MALIQKAPHAVGAVAAVALLALPFTGVADFYLSYLYVVFFWVALATSWGILSGYTGYWSFGHAAFFGAGVTRPRRSPGNGECRSS